MTQPAEPALRLLAWEPGDPPSLGLLEGLCQAEFFEEILRFLPEDIQDQIHQATLDDLTHLGLVALGPGGRHRLTPAGQTVLDQAAGDEDPGGPVWQLTLSRPGPGLPWVIDEIAEVTQGRPPGAGLVCPAGAAGRA